MENVYFISGLGADKRAFQFLDLGFCNPVFVEWIAPMRGENMKDYSVRLKDQIKDELPVIVGLSFGGMIAMEMAAHFPVKKVILLSSAKNEKEIPFYMRSLRYLPLHKAVSPSFLRSANQLVYRLMGIAKRNDKMIIKEMLKDANDHFVSWAIHQVIHWKNDNIFRNVVHIHGTSDILLPYKYIKADHAVKGGDHFMIIQKANTISKLLQSAITNPL